MKNRRILWNVLRHPEKIERDERVEQMELKSYRWSYTSLYYIILFTAIWGRSIPELLNLGMDGGVDSGGFVVTFIYMAVMLLENGRYLYRCYQGFPERTYSDGIGGSMLTFLLNTLVSGFMWMIPAAAFLGFETLWDTAAFWGGAAFYFLLCHVAYYRYAVLMGEEKIPKKKRKSLKALTLSLTVLYFVGVISADLGALCYRASFPYAPATVRLSSQEMEELVELQKGIDQYHNLEYAEYECRYETDAENPAPEYENGMTAHSRYFVTPQKVYTRFFYPEDEEGEEKVYREFYGEYETDKGMLWHESRDGVWVSEKDLAQGEYFGNTQPYTGIQLIDAKEIASVKKTDITEGKHEGCERYTLVYREDKQNVRERSNEPDNQISDSIEEDYVINEYGCLVYYELRETGRLKNSSQRYEEKESIEVLEVKKKEVIQKLENYLAE